MKSSSSSTETRDETEAQPARSLPGRLQRALRGALGVHMGEVVEGASVALVVRIAGALFAFAFNAILARQLGSRGAGLFFLTIAVFTAMVLLGKAGVDVALLRFTAEYRAIGDEAGLAATYRRILRMALASSSVAPLGLYLLAPGLAAHVFREPGLEEPLRWICLALLPACLLQIHAEGLRGLRRILVSQALGSVLVPLLAIAAFLFVFSRPEVLGAVWARMIGIGVSALLALSIWWQGIRPGRPAKGGAGYREIWRSSGPAAVVQLSALVNRRWPLFLLGAFWASEEVGVFGIAQRCALLVSFGLGAVNAIVAPKFAALFRQDRRAELAVTARRSTWMLSIAAVPVAIGLVVFAGEILALFGEDYVGRGRVLSILALGQLVNMATGPAGLLLMMTGHEADVGRISAWTSVVALLFGLALIPRGGVIGASVVASATVAFSNLAYVAQVRRRLGIALFGRS